MTYSLSHFSKLLNVKFSKYDVENDKCSSLSAICTRYGCKHLSCLKHFLTSLELQEYSKQIGDLGFGEMFK